MNIKPTQHQTQTFSDNKQWVCYFFWSNKIVEIRCEILICFDMKFLKDEILVGELREMDEFVQRKH